MNGDLICKAVWNACNISYLFVKDVFFELFIAEDRAIPL